VSRKSIPEAIRNFVLTRAQGRCEYCLLHQDDSIVRHNVDHIIALKHEGSAKESNLALACVECNQNKGSDIATLDPHDGRLVRLFDPRKDEWADHFVLVGARIEGRTSIGRGTAFLLQFNELTRVRHRRLLQTLSRYPTN